ncbi:MAG TPA: hypothetical protein VMZ29_15490, partial [Candidatus Bathyarchaeia archaeon]|nr:hypothetical protein [Candidatus Bathyarchaeia archaeon]
YTYGSGYYHIYLPSGTVYINRMRTIKTGYVSYDGNIVSTLYLNAKDITLRFYGTILEDNIINDINVVNAPLISLNISKDVSGYSNIITDKVVYVYVYDKSNNFLKCVSCNQATGYYDTGSFEAPAGNIKIEIWTTAPKKYKTINYIDEFLTSTIEEKNFKMQRNLGDVWVYGTSTGIGLYEDLNNFTLMIADPRNEWPIAFYIQNQCPPTITYQPTGAEETFTWISTYFRTVGWDGVAEMFNIRGAKVSIYTRNIWSHNTDFLNLARIHYDATSQYSASTFDWTIQASLGYSGLSSPITGQIQLATTFNPAEGVGVSTNTTKSIGDDWTKLGIIKMDYSDDYNNMEKILSTNWEIGINNGENPGELFSLYQCGSNIQYKIVYEFDVYHRMFGFWHTQIGKITFEVILGDNTESGISTLWEQYVSGPLWAPAYEITGDYNANDYNLNLLRGLSSTLPIS